MAEYNAKGIAPGDDPELDKRFEKEKEDLHQKMLNHEQWIKELKSTERYDQIADELNADDPYQLNRDNLPEPDPSSDYFKGFQQGYKLQALAPEMNEAFIRSGDPNDARMIGMKDGRNQHIKDKDLDPASDISKEIWDELDMNSQDIQSGTDKEKTPNREKDI